MRYFVLLIIAAAAALPFAPAARSGPAEDALAISKAFWAAPLVSMGENFAHDMAARIISQTQKNGQPISATAEPVLRAAFAGPIAPT